MDFTMDPKTMGLLGIAQGLLQSSGASPRQITMGEAMGNGLQGGIQGYQNGLMMDMQQQQAKMQQQKMLEQMQMKQILQDTIANQQESGKVDPVSIGNALISTGHPGLVTQGLGILKDFRSKVKSTQKGLDAQGNPKLFNVFDTGEMSATDITPAEKLMQINQGSQIGLANPYTGQIQSAVGVGMTPGQSAQLAQSANQFAQSHGLAQQQAQFNNQKALMELDPEYQAKKAEMIAGGRESGKLRAETMADLPQSIGVLAESLNLSDDLKNHPALENMVGGLPTRMTGKALAAYGGNKQADFSAKMDQAQGKQFLSAIQYMKGFGALTEREGDKMQSSAAAMNVAQSPKDFKKANDDYQAALMSGARKIAFKLGIPEKDISAMLNKERSALRQSATAGASGSFDMNDDSLWGQVR